jgi:hypothetical protein
MPKITFMIIIITLTAAILSPAVVGNAFAKSSGGDSGGSDGSGGNSGDDSDNKPKTSGHKKGDSDGGGMPVPGVPVVTADNKHKDKERNGAGGRGPPVPGLPVVTSDGNDGDNRDGYNNRNIKSFDTSKSSFRISGSGSRIVQYMPGFNETFYNSTLPYCFAVTSGSCYDSSTGQVVIP